MGLDKSSCRSQQENTADLSQWWLVENNTIADPSAAAVSTCVTRKSKTIDQCYIGMYEPGRQCSAGTELVLSALVLAVLGCQSSENLQLNIDHDQHLPAWLQLALPQQPQSG